MLIAGGQPRLCLARAIKVAQGSCCALLLLLLPPSCGVQVKEILWQSVDILAKKLENLNAGVREATGMAGQPMDQGY